jgi:hypothetical protein
MGHAGDPLGYDKAYKDEDWVRGEYMRAMPFLNVLTNDRAFGKVDIDEIDRLTKENLGMNYLSAMIDSHALRTRYLILSEN